MPFDLFPLARGMVLCCDLINTVDAVNRTQNVTNTPIMDKAHAINRLVILGLVLTQVGMEISGAPAKDLQIENALEYLPRIAEIGFRITKEAWQIEEDLQEAKEENRSAVLSQGIFRIIEKGLIAPGADLVRVFAESGIYQEQAYLELSPEKFAKTKRFIPLDDEGHYEEVPLNREECIANRAAYEQVSIISSFIRTSAQIGIGSTTVQTTKNIYLQLALFVRHLNGVGVNQPANRPVNVVRLVAPVAVAEQPPQNRVQRGVQTDNNLILEVREAIDFLGLPFIPSPLHQDPAFSKYICPITNLPIRDPVGDPNGRTLYEREAIIIWLDTCRRKGLLQNSPVTHLPLSVEQLIEKPALKLLIDRRLELFQNELRRHMETPEFQANFATAVAAELQAAVDLENPY